MIGKTISHYKILEKLGEGDMGVVYKAQDTKLDRIVALRFLPSHALGSEKEKTRFIHEAQVLSTLDHPNIAKTYEVGEAEGEYFICMDYLEGKSLKDIVQHRTISLKAVLEIAIQIGEGLNYAHKKKIIHRNIRSENIMLSERGGIKIINFGLPMTKASSGFNKNGATLEAVPYMSPEQAQGTTLDHRTDVFSFGVVLYEMITGQLPFKGEDVPAIIHSVVNENPEPLAKYKREAPEQFQKIIDRLLQKDIKLRYQNMDAVLADLKRLKLELISKKPLVFRKVRPKYKTLLIPALIISLIIAITMLVILSKYLLKPILEKKGSVPPDRSMGVTCFEEKKTEYVFVNLSQKRVINSGAKDFL